MAGHLRVVPLTSARWADLEDLFGRHGAYGNCWCMYWRVPRREFSSGTDHGGEGNRHALRALVEAGRVPGLLAYFYGVPVGWCAIGPRTDFPPLNRSRTLRRVDDQPVWSIVCFFMAKGFRGKGLMGPFLRAAISWAQENGAQIVEGYPEDPGDQQLTGYSGYMGLVSAFEKAGFVEVERRTPRQPIMRYYLGIWHEAQE